MHEVFTLPHSFLMDSLHSMRKFHGIHVDSLQFQDGPNGPEHTKKSAWNPCGIHVESMHIPRNLRNLPGTGVTRNPHGLHGLCGFQATWSVRQPTGKLRICDNMRIYKNDSAKQSQT
ncbi:hypothetical protein F5887DRAFT_924652 [Amanita rubescens]|nr:hypothetical protein F5887DRAFT_924652 [Amanita rubescens]